MIYTFLQIGVGGLRRRATQVEAQCLTPHHALRKPFKGPAFVARELQRVWQKGDTEML